MKVVPTSVAGVLIIEPRVFKDSRGFFMESYQQSRYQQAGIDRTFVQDNLSHSIHGTLRGLHYQLHRPQAKLIQVIRGEIFDVAVDIRRGSPSFGEWTASYLSEENRRQMFIAEGLAHGFCVISEIADVIYKCTSFYAPEDEGGIIWSDPDLKIDWPVSKPLLSVKDSQLPPLREIASDRLPTFKGGQ